MDMSFLSLASKIKSRYKKIKENNKKKVLRDIIYATTYNESEFFDYMVAQVRKIKNRAMSYLLIGPSEKLEKIKSKLTSDYAGANIFHYINLSLCIDITIIKKELDKQIETLIDSPDAILVIEDNPKFVYDVVGVLNHMKNLSDIPVIYKVGVASYYETLHEFDGPYKGGTCIDNTLDYPIFNREYKKSLELFEQKCQVRDAWDLFQCLNLTKDVPGDIIEIGSYKGHSGWLITQFSHELSPMKNIFLCDTFEYFPQETQGIDQMWSNTHMVDYNQVLEKFEEFDNVNLVKGDIRETLDGLSDKTWGLIYIDVDSYSATLFALKKLYPNLSSGGIVLNQDYGKPHCLGARLAVDEFFKEKNIFRYFSFFSGCKLFLKHD